jgi:peptidyl-prolyl cis-trans isomerase C
MISKKSTLRKVSVLCVLGGSLMSVYASETQVEMPKADAVASVVQAVKVIAKVNGKEISSTELEREISRARNNMPPDTSAEQLRESALDQLIDKNLLSQYALAEKITVSDEAVAERLTGIKANFPDIEALNSALAQDGLTLDTLSEVIKEGLLIQNMIDTKVAVGVTVGDEEVKKFYDENPTYFVSPEQVHARHILMKLEASSSDEEKAKARAELAEVKKELAAGKTFAECATLHSQGPSAPNGGDLGFFGKGQMVPAFEEVAFAMKIGEVSDVVETQFGYHLIYVEEKKAGGTQSLEEVSGKIKTFLNRNSVGEAVEKLLKDLKSKAKIEMI